MKLFVAAATAAMLMLTVPTAQAQTAPAKVADTSKGKSLVDAKGMTLYVFDRDSAGKSACNGPCATNWPPLMAAADAKADGDWTIVTRDDKGKPLYTWKSDAKPGDATGDGVNNNTWHIAKP